MNGSARSRRGRRRGIGTGLVIGVIVVSGALVAVLHDSGDDTEADARPEPPEAVEVTRELPAVDGDVGSGEPDGSKVWITITAADRAPRSVTIRRASRETTFFHESADPEIYWFYRDPPLLDTGNPPTAVRVTVRIEPGADVAFDQGAPPVGAHDRSGGWDYSG